MLVVDINNIFDYLHNVPDRNKNVSKEIKHLHYLITSGKAKIKDINFGLFTQTDLENYSKYYLNYEQSYHKIEQTVVKLASFKPISCLEDFI